MERGHLTRARCARQNATSSEATSSPGATSGISCTTAFTSSPRSALGTPNTAASATLGCVMSRFSLSRIDIHAPRDDHEGRAVRQVDEAVGIDIADIADRAHRTVGRACFRSPRRIVEILEWRRRLEPQLSRLADWAFPHGLIEHMQLAEQDAPHGAPVREPFGAVAGCEAEPLRGPIVFVDDGPPPFDHLLLDGDRAGRGSVHSALQRGEIVAS